ncbi:MAG: glutamate--cysteine ligase [Deltaproteobacteria bacterium]|nr:glutamate--cysteine ligase [Deltaproteobacteria bacterium]
MLALDQLNVRLKEILKGCEYRCLDHIKRGIEKEALRITADGRVSQGPHPQGLGAPLTHPFITTDYAEALLEFVTPTFEDTKQLLLFMQRVHQYVYRHIDSQLLWPCSMPCMIESADEIRIAAYGTSNLGRLKHIYRKGLEHRYGKKMQCIAGVHYNCSFPERFWCCYQESIHQTGDLQAFINDGYFKIIRNFERWAWMLILLFGASPVVCTSFFNGGDLPAGLDALDPCTLYRPYATSLRMGDFGYKSRVQQGMNISYNNLDEYVSDLIKAMTTGVPEYEQMGVKRDGEYIQLNTNYLQVENEYYGLIRPKRAVVEGERSTQALNKRGVEYLEIRCLDVNPLSPIGVDRDQLLFIDTFLLYCVLEDSPTIGRDEMRIIRANHKAAVCEGRNTSTRLFDVTRGQWTTIKDWGHELFDRMKIVACYLDEGDTNGDYTRAVKTQRARLENPDLTPSGGILGQLKNCKIPFYHHAMGLAREYKQSFNKTELPVQDRLFLEQAAQDSIRDQDHLERSDTVSLNAYIERYLRT